MLAYWTKRTLVLPPIILGTAVPWRPFNDMLTLYKTAQLTFSQILPLFQSPTKNLTHELSGSNIKSIFVPWSLLVNLNDLKPYIRIITESEFEKLYRVDRYSLGSLLSLTGKFTLNFVQDVTRHDYFIHSSPIDINHPKYIYTKNRFDRAIHIHDEDISTSPSLLIFGSLFSSSRLYIEAEKDEEMFRRIKKSFVIQNPYLEYIANLITEKLGGIGHYIGIHVRIGEGNFALRSQKTLNTIIYNVTAALSNINNSYDHHKDIDDHDEQIPEKGESLSSFKMRKCFHSQSVLDLKHKRNSNRASSRSKYPIIFMATDIRNPNESSLLEPLYSLFPCIFTLNDFKKEISLAFEKPHLNDQDTHSLDEKKDESLLYDIFNPVSGRFMIPFIDLLVASRGNLFFGSPASTFSTFGAYLHKIRYGD